jgi:hypothetical protein
MHRILLACCLLALAACDDPAPVGVNLVDEQSGTPFLIEVPAERVSLVPATNITGNAPRALFGNVDDPDLGTTESLAYLDFVATGVKTSVFENGVVTSASVLLSTDYAYGDSTADISVKLRAIDSSWLGAGVAADTVLSVGASIAEQVVNYRTRTLEIPLPQSWVAQWDTTLRGSSFDDSFFGFEISTDTRASILGIDVLTSAIRAVSAGDTTIFPASRSLTRFVRGDVPPAGPDALTFQDGRANAVEVAFDFSPHTQATLVLNRGVVRLPADTTLSLPPPGGLVRPVIQSLQLEWVGRDGARVAIALGLLNDNSYDFESQQLHDSLNVLLRGRSFFDRFEVRVPDAENTVSVIRLPVQPSEQAPRVLLAVTPVR